MKVKSRIQDHIPEFAEAQQILLKYLPRSMVKSVPLLEAVGRVLAENIKVSTDSPPFHQSAMDGYAFNFKRWDKVSPLRIIDEIPAGGSSKKLLKANDAVRVFTGSAVPATADTVVVQENVIRAGAFIHLKDPSLKSGANIRKKGSQIKSGRIACRSGQLLSVGAISYFASLGIEKVKIFAPPVVSIIVTGNELSKPGSRLPPGHVFECNSFGLTAALGKIQIVPALIVHCKDKETDLVKAIRKSLKVSDILILTGGVSVGDYDFVAAGLEKCGVKKKFHKVRQKPGKPLYFGVYGKKLIFGLPGNPAAVLSCYYTFVLKAISAMMKVPYTPTVLLPAMNSYSKKGTLTNILKARTAARGVEILDHQESYKLNALVVADSLVILPPDKQEVKPGDMLEVLLIDN
jgi:molybdopterin molybdotransferase